MENGDWVIPFTCTFSIKKVHSFNADRACIDVDMIMFIYFKFTGLKFMEKIMHTTIDLFKCRINEEEMKLVDPWKGRDGSWKMLASSDHHEGMHKDILKGRILLTQKFFCEFQDYIDYPFDMPNFCFRFELSHMKVTINE